MSNLPRVTVWNEYRHEKTNAAVTKIYPDGIHQAIAQHLNTCRACQSAIEALDLREDPLISAVRDSIRQPSIAPPESERIVNLVEAIGVPVNDVEVPGNNSMASEGKAVHKLRDYRLLEAIGRVARDPFRGPGEGIL